MNFNTIKLAIKNNAGKYITKGVGLGALGLCAYESNYVGKIKADKYATERDALATAHYLNNTMYSNDLSPVKQRIKETAYSIELNQGWRRFFNLGIGYVKGFCDKLISNVIPLGLGLGALLAKGKAAKGCAIGLAIYGTCSLIKNFFGIGVPRGPLE